MEFVNEADLQSAPAKPSQASDTMQFPGEYAITGQHPKPPTFLENLGGFLTDADSWKEMGTKAGQVVLGTGDLILGIPGMAAGVVANMGGRAVAAAQGKGRKEVEEAGLAARAYIPEGFITPLQNAAKSLGLAPLDQSGMEAVMNAAGGAAEKYSGGVVSDQDAKDLIEMVFLKGMLQAGKSVTSAVKAGVDKKYGAAKPPSGDLRKPEVTWEEVTDAPPAPVAVKLTPEQVIKESQKRIAAKRKDVRTAVKAETPAEKAARMGVRQLEEGPATWNSGGVDIPVQVRGAAELGPDGNYYTPVLHEGTKTYVPTKELTRPASEPQVGLPPPVEPPPLFPPAEGAKGRWETPIVGAKADALASALEKTRSGQAFNLTAEERVVLQGVKKSTGKIEVPPERTPSTPYVSGIRSARTAHSSPLLTGITKLRAVSELSSMEQAQLRADPATLLSMDERAALRATQQAGAKVAGPGGKPLGAGFTEGGAVDPKLLAALGISSVAVWAALRPEDMEKLGMLGVIGATTLSAKARSVGALIKEGAPYHFETMLKLPQGATELGVQQVRDMASKFPAEAAIVERVLGTVEGKKISAADLHAGLMEETAGWKLKAEETGQYADYGLQNIERGELVAQGATTTTLFRLPEHMQVSDANHFRDNRLYGWTRSFKEDGVTHVVELQSDLAQHMKELPAEEISALRTKLASLEAQEKAAQTAYERYLDVQTDQRIATNLQQDWLRAAARVSEVKAALAAGTASTTLSPVLKNWPRRLIRETLLKEEQVTEPFIKDVQAKQQALTQLQQKYATDPALKAELLQKQDALYAREAALRKHVEVVRNEELSYKALATADALELQAEAIGRRLGQNEIEAARWELKDAQEALAAQPRTVRFASADTVAKVEGWPVKPEYNNGKYSANGVTNFLYESGHQSIYNRYAGEITRYLKGLGGKEYTDPQGHTWWEVPTDIAWQSYGPGIKMLGAADTKLLTTLAAGASLGAYLIANPDSADNILIGLGLGLAVKGGLRDADLLGHIKAGGKVGEAASAELYRRYAPQMERTLQGKFGRQGVDIQEAIQDGFFHSIRVVEKGHFRGDAEFSTYLHRAVVNRALNQLRAEKSRPETVSLTEDPSTGRSKLAETLGHDDTPANQLQARDLGAQIEKALDAIDPRFRDAFLAVERDGMSYEEAAAQQGIPINTLRSRIYRAKEGMQKQLAEYGEGAGLERTPGDSSTSAKPRMGDYERGMVTADQAKILAVISGGAALGALYADDPVKGAIIGGLIGLSGTLLNTRPAVAAIGRSTTRLAEIDPALRRASRAMEQAASLEISQASNVISKFIRPVKALPSKASKALDKAYSEADPYAMAQVMRGNPELVAGYASLRTFLQNLETRLVAVGRFKKGIPDYLPLMVKDYKGLMESLGREVRTGLEERLHKANIKSLKVLKRELSEVEKAVVINDYLLNEPSTSYLPAFAKARRLKMTEANRQYYHTMENALIHYSHAAIADLAATKFFGQDLKTIRVKGKQFTNVEGSIGQLIGRALEEGRMTPEQAVKAQQILHARFVGGEKAPPGWMQDVRNASGTLLLGQIGSGLIQTSESLLSAYHHGIVPALKAAVILATGKGIKPSEFGLANHVIEEVIGSRPSGKVLSVVLKVNLLAALDQLGISQNLTASYVKNSALAKTARGQAKLNEKWGADYGPDMPQLIKELQQSTRTKRTPLVETLLYQELADIRPVSRMEAPELYNAHPRTRLAYQLKQFMLTQADLLYRDSYSKIKTGNPKQVAIGLKNLALYAAALSVVTIPANAIKDWIFGRGLQLDEIDYVQNFVQNFGLSRYTMDKVATSSDPGKAFIQAVKAGVTPPAFSVVESLGSAVSDPKKLVPYIPLAGRAYYNRELGGNERAEVAEKAGTKKHLSPAAERYLRKKRAAAKKAKLEKERSRRYD